MTIMIHKMLVVILLILILVELVLLLILILGTFGDMRALDMVNNVLPVYVYENIN